MTRRRRYRQRQISRTQQTLNRHPIEHPGGPHHNIRYRPQRQQQVSRRLNEISSKDVLQLCDVELMIADHDFFAVDVSGDLLINRQITKSQTSPIVVSCDQKSLPRSNNELCIEWRLGIPTTVEINPRLSHGETVVVPYDIRVQLPDLGHQEQTALGAMPNRRRAEHNRRLHVVRRTNSLPFLKHRPIPIKIIWGYH